jgi:hypothetical protein
MIDFSADYQWRKYTSLSVYFGYAFGGDVIDRLYPSSGNGALGYFEVTQRF